MPAPSKTQSHTRYPLTSIFGSAGNVRVLRVLFSDRTLHSAPQLARAAGLSPQGARLILQALISEQLISVHGTGRGQLYSANVSSALAGAIAELFSSEQQRWDELLAAIRGLLMKQGSDIRAAWLYGSVARGLDTVRSDLDLALLVKSQEVAELLRDELSEFGDRRQLRIGVTALTPNELAAVRDDSAWWSSVVRDGRVLKGASPEAAKREVTRTVGVGNVIRPVVACPGK